MLTLANVLRHESHPEEHRCVQIFQFFVLLRFDLKYDYGTFANFELIVIDAILGNEEV